jgi:hypothetical protein
MNWFCPPSFEAEDRLAFFHQFEAIAGDRFQISRIRLQERYSFGLLSEDCLLFIQLSLELFDFRPILLQLFVGREEKTDDEKPDGDEKQDAKDVVHLLPDGGLTSRPQIAVAGGVH